MKSAEEMKKFSEEVLESFRNRIKKNDELVNEVQKTLEGFRKDHQEMASVLNANALELRQGLAKGENERLNSYNTLMKGIHSTITTIQQEVATIQTTSINLIDEFTSNRTAMAEKLHETFVKDRAERMLEEQVRTTEFNGLMNDINVDIKNINDEVTTIIKNTNEMLSAFGKEHHKMSTELKSELNDNLAERVAYTRDLLNGFQKRIAEVSNENQKMAKAIRENLTKGEAERMKEYNGVLEAIHTSIKSIQKEVFEVRNVTSQTLNDYSNDRKNAATAWHSMQAAVAEIRRVGLGEQPNPIENTVVTAIEVENPAETVPVEMDSNVEDTTENNLTLAEKVLDLINKHPDGLKISEMEKPLGETRIKLGFTAKLLLDEGKVLKVEKLYFPLKDQSSS